MKNMKNKTLFYNINKRIIFSTNDQKADTTRIVTLHRFTFPTSNLKRLVCTNFVFSFNKNA
jgi:hypothetical protein